MHRMEQRRLHPLLQVETVMHETQKPHELPLVLLIAAGRAEDETAPVLFRQRRGQRGARSAARRERGGQPLVEPEHLGAGIERKAQARDDRRALQPAARGGRGDHVAPFVDHVEMHGVAALFRQVRHGRLLRRGVGVAVEIAGCAFDRGIRLMLEPFDPARALLGRSGFRNQSGALGAVGVREQHLHRDVGLRGVSVIGLAVGIGELHRLDDGMHEVRTVRVHRREIEVLEDRQRLKQHRPLPPWPGLVHRPAMVVDRDRRLVAGAPAGHVGAGQYAAIAALRDVVHLGVLEIVFDRLGDEALGPHRAGGVDARLAGRALGLRQPLIGVGKVGVAEQLMRLRRAAARCPDGGGGRPFGLEILDQPLHRRGDARQDRVAVARIVDGRAHHIGDLHRAVVAQQQHPAVEGAGDHRGQEPGAGNEVDAQPLVMLDRGARRGRTLTADHFHLAGLGGPEDHRQIARRTVEMRLDHLQDQRRRHRLQGDAGAGHQRLQQHVAGAGLLA